ncbi:MAG: biopolymer transporter ExbD [Spirochaetia bacterium]|nr:biopolymer transporter ExbD [Spirochaetia bacterium]
MRTNDEELTVSGINVTPLVDVMMVLLIIFMATATFVNEKALEVNLPKAATKENAPTPAIAVTLGKDGTLKVMKREATLDELGALLSKELNAHPDEKVLLKADKDLPYHMIAQVLDAMKKAGVRKVALAMETK